MIDTPLPKLTVVGIYVWHGKAYVPTQGQYESGIFVDIDPVYITSINVEQMGKAIRTVKEVGHKKIPDPKTREEFLARKDPILSATGTRNWKQLAKTGASYNIAWTEKEVRIDMSRLNKKGVWEFDLEKVRKLPPDSSIEQIAEIILEDLKTRPEVWSW